MIAPPTTPALAVRGATKRFGAVVALDGVDLEVHRGEVLALLGDNGAGKSTLIKCISGVHRLDVGLDRDGRRSGQHPLAVDGPCAAASRPSTRTSRSSTTSTRPPTSTPAVRRRDPRWLPRGLRVLSRGSMVDATDVVLRRLQVTLPDPRAAVGLMSGGQRQAIAVARAAAFASNVVILDEPTAALGVRESRQVLDLIRRLRDDGHAVIVISHAMDHVMEVADRAAVMRRGRKVGEEVPTATANSGSSR